MLRSFALIVFFLSLAVTFSSAKKKVKKPKESVSVSDSSFSSSSSSSTEDERPPFFPKNTPETIVPMKSVPVASASKSKNDKSVNISKWEYCEGCKLTVEAYSQRAYTRMKEMQAKKIPDYEVLESGSIMEGICDDDFEKYDPAMKHSCIKIFSSDDDGKAFMQAFEGKTSALTANSPSEVYSRKKAVCVDKLAACSELSFGRAVPREEQSTCRACQAIADDLDMHLRIMKKKTKQKMAITLEEVCSRLGYNHLPFSWLDQVCEDLAEDKSEQIADIKKFRDRVAATGLNPEKRLRDMICDEIFQCDKPTSKNNKKPVATSATTATDSSSSSSSSSSSEAEGKKIKSTKTKVKKTTKVDDDDDDAEL